MSRRDLIRPLSTRSQPVPFVRCGFYWLRLVSLVLGATLGAVSAYGQTETGSGTGNTGSVSAMEISDAIVRAPIPGRSMSAAFLTLKNSGSGQDRLLSAKADWADHIEIHMHTHANGVMKMRQIDGLDVPAGQTVTLQPGGLHLMLFGLQQPLPAVIGKELPLTLCFVHSGCLLTTATLVDMRQ